MYTKFHTISTSRSLKPTPSTQNMESYRVIPGGPQRPPPPISSPANKRRVDKYLDKIRQRKGLKAPSKSGSNPNLPILRNHRHFASLNSEKGSKLEESSLNKGTPRLDPIRLENHLTDTSSVAEPHQAQKTKKMSQYSDRLIRRQKKKGMSLSNRSKHPRTHILDSPGMARLRAKDPLMKSRIFERNTKLMPQNDLLFRRAPKGLNPVKLAQRDLIREYLNRRNQKGSKDRHNALMSIVSSKFMSGEKRRKYFPIGKKELSARQLYKDWDRWVRKASLMIRERHGRVVAANYKSRPKRKKKLLRYLEKKEKERVNMAKRHAETLAKRMQRPKLRSPKPKISQNKSKSQKRVEEGLESVEDLELGRGALSSKRHFILKNFLNKKKGELKTEAKTWEKGSFGLVNDCSPKIVRRYPTQPRKASKGNKPTLKSITTRDLANGKPGKGKGLRQYLQRSRVRRKEGKDKKDRKGGGVGSVDADNPGLEDNGTGSLEGIVGWAPRRQGGFITDPDDRNYLDEYVESQLPGELSGIGLEDSCC